MIYCNICSLHKLPSLLSAPCIVLLPLWIEIKINWKILCDIFCCILSWYSFWSLQKPWYTWFLFFPLCSFIIFRIKCPKLFNFLAEVIYFIALICLIQLFQIIFSDLYVLQNVLHYSQAAQNRKKPTYWHNDLLMVSIFL